MTAARFREDVRKTKAILESLIGKTVWGYRAPSFTIMDETLWALPILVEEGYRYDSSVFPVFHDKYGLPGADPSCHRLETYAGPLWEIPPSTVKVGGVRLPVAGGGYLRLYPYFVFQRLIRRSQKQSSPLVVYLHAWELDPSQPAMNGPWLSRFRQYVNLHKTEGRLCNLLREFRFGPISDVIEPLKRLRLADKVICSSTANLVGLI
jgi:polysaccharide deacetylase family protein (PEP-CTERM system associated)